MRLTILAAAFALAVSPVAASPATAQAATVEPATVEPASGLTAAEVRNWLTGFGLSVDPVQRTEAGGYWFYVKDGAVLWRFDLKVCTGEDCGMLRMMTAAQGSDATLEEINAWNSRQSFVSAARSTGADRAVVLRYDLVIQPGLGVEQLTDPLAIWVETVPQFRTDMRHRSATQTQN